MKSWQLVLLGTLFGFLAAGLVLLVATRPVKSVVTILHPSQTTTITVDVGGAVLHPGVYALPVGSRINDAVQLAGGFSPTADSREINLAAVIRDGEKILIPEISPTEKLIDLPNSDSILVNLNTATVDELEQLPGIRAAESRRDRHLPRVIWEFSDNFRFTLCSWYRSKYH